MKENKYLNLWTVLFVLAVLTLLFVSGGCDSRKQSRHVPRPHTVTVYSTPDTIPGHDSTSDLLFWYIMLNNGTYYSAGPTTTIAPASSFRDMTWNTSTARPGVTTETEAKVVANEQATPEELPPAIETEIMEAEGRDGQDIDETPEAAPEPGSSPTPDMPPAVDAAPPAESAPSGGDAGGSGGD